MPVVMFDMDGVLSSRDTMEYYLRELVLESPLRVAAALPVLAARKVLRRSIRMQGSTSRAMVRIARWGLSTSEFERRATASGARQAGLPDWPIAQGLAALRRHVAEGSTVVVTTGTERHVAAAFLDGLGLDGFTLLASADDAAGRYRHNFSRGKVASARMAGIDIASALFYTDSVTDLALAVESRSTVLVDPDPFTERAFRRRVPQLEIVRWISPTSR